MRTYPLATYSLSHLLALLGISLFFLAGGIGHFVFSSFFIAIVPPYVPTPALTVAISGVCELAGVIGLLMTGTRRMAGIGLLLLIVAVFPANLYMAQHPEQFDAFAPWLLYARLPLQLVLLAWVGFAMRTAGHRSTL